jgi:ribulose-bisphosphate carboxylase large chain
LTPLRGRALIENMTAPRFSVTYRITPTDGRPPEAHARDICIEQTVEIPEDCIPENHWKAGIIGQVESLSPVAEAAGSFDAVISYRVDITSNAIPNFLNVLYGNISILEGIRVIDVGFADEQFASFGGPHFGVDGLRKALGVHGRPLATTALKPMGLSASDIAALAGGFARGGLDIIKDDHGLVDQHFHPFEERIMRVMDAVRAANAKTGGATQYYPMIAGTHDQVEAQMSHARQHGCFGVLVPPLLIGPDTGFRLARKYGLAVMTHPTFTGTHFHDRKHGISPAVLLGQLFRLFGADISVFPNYGGRFSFSKAECLDLADALRKPMGSASHPIRSAFPAPAGGMSVAKVGDMTAVYGTDTALLIGGALLRDPKGPEASARAFVTALEDAIKKEIPA